MIFKSPDALVIKYIKLIHAIILVCIGYSLYKSSNISDFYTHVSKVKTIIGENNLPSLFNIYLFAAIIFSLILTVIILILLIKKKKSFIFYAVTAIFLAGILVFYVMSYGNIATMQKGNVAAPVYLAYGDISRIVFYIQSIFVFIFMLKATGFDVKSFSFGENVFGVDLTDADSEEIEFNLEIDVNEIKTKKKRKMRYLKYFYLENKFKINMIIFIIILGGIFFTYNLIVSNKEIYYSLKDELSSQNYTLAIENIYATDLDYRGNKIGKNDVFLILTFKIKKDVFDEKVFDSSYISIEVNGKKYYADNKYSEYFIDFGTAYKEQKLTQDYAEYYLVYKIPYEFSTKDIYVYSLGSFNYSTNSYNRYKIQASYQRADADIKMSDYRIGETMEIEAYGQKNSTHITSAEFQNKYKLIHKGVINNKEYDITEYIVPTAADDEDKTIMKLEYETTKDSNENFATILSKYATIEYEVDGIKKESKIYSFLAPKLTKEPNTYYIQISRDVLDGTNRTIRIKIRNYIYEYKLD